MGDSLSHLDDLLTIVIRKKFHASLKVEKEKHIL